MCFAKKPRILCCLPADPATFLSECGVLAGVLDGRAVFSPAMVTATENPRHVAKQSEVQRQEVTRLGFKGAGPVLSSMNTNATLGKQPRLGRGKVDLLRTVCPLSPHSV